MVPKAFVYFLKKNKVGNFGCVKYFDTFVQKNYLRILEIIFCGFSILLIHIHFISSQTFRPKISDGEFYLFEYKLVSLKCVYFILLLSKFMLFKFYCKISVQTFAAIYSYFPLS